MSTRSIGTSSTRRCAPDKRCKTEGRITRVEHKRGKFYFVLEYESRDAATDELLMRQAITSVLLLEGKIA